jgi:threonine-phosphate decarboxylase
MIPLHGGQLRAISERFGIPVSELIDFSANINPEGPPPAVLATLRASLDDASMLTAYPDLEETELRQAIAGYAGVREQHVAVANGFIPLLECALRALQVKRCLLPVPAFVEYRRSLARVGVAVEPLVLSKSRYDFDAMLEGNHDAVLLANPQNPSGVLTQRGPLLEFVTRCIERNIVVLLDEAFIDYAPDQSLTSAVDRYPTLIVFRSVTKFHGIPGLRVAYAAASESAALQLRENLPPWPITTLAARGVAAALGDEAYAVRTRRLNEQRKNRLRAGLEAIGLNCHSSAANFLLLRLPPGIPTASFWERMIVDHRLVLRDCSNYEGLPPGHLRVAIRSEGDNDHLIAAATKVLDSMS